MFTPGKQISDFPDASIGATAARHCRCVRACLSWNSLEHIIKLCWITVRKPIMYAVKVNVKQSTEDADLSEEASRLATALLAEQVLEATGSSDHIQDAVSFSAGNPRVEHLTGKVHLYRQISDPEQAQQRKQLPVSNSYTDQPARLVTKQITSQARPGMCRLTDQKDCVSWQCH